MKLSTALRDVQTSEEVVHQSFRIGDPSKMFGILADKIYSDKPRAVIREIACNALDAHTAVGQPKPFRISTPSALSPMFVVRDYGPGLSHDDVIGLYTTFFDSTKSSNNDSIGGFGLGSKSPFAYTDAFTVTSYQAGKKRIYAAFRGADSVPQISLAATENTNEHDGLEVQVPVRREDHDVFVKTAASVMQWFPEGSYESFGFKPATTDWLLKTPRWGVRKGVRTERRWDATRNAYDEAGDYVALMGPVGYGLDWRKTGQEVLPVGIVPFFNIGELDLPPSRETLSYDPATIQALKDMRALILAELPKLAHDTCKALDPWDQCQFVAELKENGLSKIVAAKYNPSGLRNYTPDPFKDMSDGIILRGEVDYFEESYRSSNLKRKPEPKSDYVLKPVSIAGGIKVVFDDLPTMSPGKKRTLSRLNEAGFRKILLVNNKKGEYADFEHLKKTFGKAPDLSFIKKLSELALPTVQTFASTTAYQMRLLISRNGSYFYEGTDKPSPGDLWWPMSGFDTEDRDAWDKISSFLGNKTVFGMTKTARKAFDVNQMVRADVYVTELIEKLRTDPDANAWVAKHLKAKQFVKDVETAGLTDMLNILYNRSDNGALLWPDLTVLLKSVDTPASFSDDAAKLLRAMEEGLVPMPKPEASPEVIREMKKILKKSKLLQLAVHMRQNRSSEIFSEKNDAILSQMV